MKKLIFAVVITVFNSSLAFAQYPLPATQVLGNLTVTDSVGIGTTTPTETLEVDGTALIYDAGTEFVVGEKTFTFGGVAPVTVNGVYISSEFGVTGDTTAILYFGDVNFGGQDISGARLGFTNVDDGIVGASLAISDLGVVRLEGSAEPLVGGTRTKLDLGNDIGVEIRLEGNGDNVFMVSDTLQNTMIQVDKDGTIINEALAIVDGSEADGYVLTSDASGNATWQTPQETTLYSDVTEATTTTTDWETLATYNIAANTLSANGNSLEIHMAHVGATPADSIRLVLGSTNVFLDNNAGQNNDNIKTTIARQSAGNQLFFTGNDFGTGTEDETTQLTLSFQAKSVTIGNQSLKYFKVKRSE